MYENLLLSCSKYMHFLFFLIHLLIYVLITAAVIKIESKVWILWLNSRSYCKGSGWIPLFRAHYYSTSATQRMKKIWKKLAEINTVNRRDTLNSTVSNERIFPSKLLSL
jgi:hypothetical protein